MVLQLKVHLESMGKKANWKHQPCFAHRLNKVFGFELKPINKKLLKTVALFSMPPRKNALLRDLISKDKSIGKPLGLISTIVS